jgi:pyruvate dehydrogenase (quinone)/pyruvate oxidase
MDNQSTSDIMIDRLIVWGVDIIFGLPGDGINGIMEAIRKRSKEIRFIHVRNEENAAFMATAYAKLTGKLGVCLGTTGPGGIHLLNGLYDAKMDSQPVLAITGLPYHDLISTNTQQDIELDKVFENVSVYSQRVMGAKHVKEITDLACRFAIANKGVSHITIPVDTQDEIYHEDKSSMRDVGSHTSAAYWSRSGLPNGKSLQDAAKILNNGKRIAILAGQGGLYASEELLEIAKILQSPIAKSLLGKAVISDDNPYTTGQIGLLGTTASEDIMKSCDTLFIVGSTFPYLEYYPDPGQAKAVQIDRNPERIARRYAVDVGLVGDAKETLRALMPLLKKHGDKTFLEKAQAETKKWWRKMEKRASVSDVPLRPEVPVWHLGNYLEDDAIITVDCGTNTFYAARDIKIHSEQKFILSGTLATMGAGLPYAIAAQILFPKKQVVCIVGDGGLTMNLGEFMTAVQYRMPIKVLVLRNNSLGQIKYEQQAFLGNPEFEVDLAPMDFAAFGRACGAEGFTIKTSQDAKSLIKEALGTKGPVIIDAIVDQDAIPYPPYIKEQFKKNFEKAMKKGDPRAKEIQENIQKDQVRQVI